MRSFHFSARTARLLLSSLPLVAFGVFALCSSVMTGCSTSTDDYASEENGLDGYGYGYGRQP